MQDQKLKRYLKISLIGHVVLFAVGIISQWVFPGKATLFTPTVQIDMVALPNQVKQAEPEPIDTSLPVKENPPPKPEAKEEEPDAVALPEKKSNLKDKKEAEKRAKNALEKIREQMKKEKEEEERKKQELVNKRKNDLKKFEEKYRAAIRGNQTNEGTSSTGDLQATANAYAGAIIERLRSNWSLPVFLQSKNLRASVRVYIDGRGNLVRYQFSESSGNDVFDDYVKGAIQRSNPFPPPPEEMVRGLRNSGIEVSFPL